MYNASTILEEVLIMNKGIKHVAIYLRKSRGDEEEDVLWKHRDRLTSYAQAKGWTYDIYQEIVSGGNISERPEIKKVLNLVEKGFYSGILVVDYDRLSRGGTMDFGTIIQTCQFSDTYIITPEKIYDVNDTNDLLLLGMVGVMANTELRQISKRFVEGKKAGAKRGLWTNGKPPYPYEYHKEIIIDETGRQKTIGKIVINDAKADVYKYMMYEYLSGEMGFEAIAFQLNQKGIPSPNGLTWNSNTVQRILIHKFHMGVVEYGKNVWRKKKTGQRLIVYQRSDNEIASGKGTYKPLKTVEEHNKILDIMHSNNKVPKRCMAGCFPTSGILFCKKCGSRMGYSIGRQEIKTGKIYDYTKCKHKSPTGVKCEQHGAKMTEEFYNAIYQTIINNINFDQLLDIKSELENSTDFNQIQLQKKKNELKSCKKKMQRINDAYENNLYSMSEFAERKKAQEDLIIVLNKDIAVLENETSKREQIDTEELKKRIDYFKANWYKSISNAEKNMLLKSTVKKIYYDRIGDIITFEIEYL